MTTQGRNLAGWSVTALLALILLPGPAVGLSITFRDLVDPVPPGGVLTYTIRVNSELAGEEPAGVYCFNPPPECITFPATCAIGSPSCVGNSFTGYVCENAANAGADCGVGDPPVPNLSICIPLNTGVCEGGINAGLPCSTSYECPGETFVCEHSFNEGEFCGSGSPPHADSNLCLANPTGICSGGPNIGLPCTAPHGQATAECPPDPDDPVTEFTVVNLPVPPLTTFIDADSGGTIDGSLITWNVPFGPCAAPGGVSGAPPCPVITARLTVDSLAPIGAVIENQVSATAPDGELVVRNTTTNIGTFRLVKFRLFYPRRSGRDRFVYKAFVSLSPGAEIDPAHEIFQILLENVEGPVMSFELPPGSLQEGKNGSYRYRSRGPGINRFIIRQIATGFYRIVLRASKMTLPEPGPDVTLTFTLGDDELTQPISLVNTNAGRKFIGYD